LINNELYIGKLVWNRLRYLKNPQTGKRVSRINPQSEWILTDVPHLRILDEELWQAVKARQEDIAIQYAGVIEATRSAHNAMNRTHRPKSLLSGLVSAAAVGGLIPFAGRGGLHVRTISTREAAPMGIALRARSWKRVPRRSS
jgi:hypothetical protein